MGAALFAALAGYLGAGKGGGHETSPRDAQASGEGVQIVGVTVAPTASSLSAVAQSAAPVMAVAPAPSAAAAAAEADERELMNELRDLVHKQPERAIALAREGNTRFPKGDGAAERSWVIVKSLDGLGRFHEARDEAKLMVRLYPGASWTEDVEHHSLVYPLDMPSREEQQESERREKELAGARESAAGSRESAPAVKP